MYATVRNIELMCAVDHDENIVTFEYNLYILRLGIIIHLIYCEIRYLHNG